MSKDTQQPDTFERAKADIAALKIWRALPYDKQQFARQNGLTWEGGDWYHYYGSKTTSTERTEADIAALKNWQALPEASKLFAMRHMVNWQGVHGVAYYHFMTSEVDFTKIPSEIQDEFLSGVWLPNPTQRAEFHTRDDDDDVEW
jgi:hypothetical protein